MLRLAKTNIENSINCWKYKNLIKLMNIVYKLL